MWFTCKKYNAKEALKMGLINKISKKQNLEKYTITLCTLIQ